MSASVLVPPGTINTGLFTSNRNRQTEYVRIERREEPPTLTYAQMLERMNASRQSSATDRAGRGGGVRGRGDPQRHVLDPAWRPPSRHP